MTQNTNHAALDDMVSRHVFDERWREVFILTTSSLGDASDFLKEIRAKIKSIHLSLNVKNILAKTGALIDSKANYPLPLKRALALNGILEQASRMESETNLTQLVRASESLVNRIDDLYKNIDNLESVALMTLQMGLSKNRDEIDRVARKLALLDPSEQAQLTTYIKASKLLIDCMSADAIVSVATKRELIESFLL